MHMHCCIQFRCEHFYQWIQATHEVSMSYDMLIWTPAWFAIVHVLCTDTLTIAMGIEIHQFCSLSLSLYDNILPFTKYVDVCSLIIMWKCTIETKVKLYTCSLNYLYPLNIGRKLKYFNIWRWISITWKAYWMGHGLAEYVRILICIMNG